MQKLSVRKVKTASGATAVQVVVYRGKRVTIIKHMGSARTAEELSSLLRRARIYAQEHSSQLSFFPESKQPRVLLVDRARCTSVTHCFARDFLQAAADACGLSSLDPILLDLALMRIIEPTSKLRTLHLLERYFRISYSQRIYRKMSSFYKQKEQIEKIALTCASKHLKEDLYLVLYDVTTLYFESFKEDLFRKPGFSKDDKSRQPQVIVGLLVTSSGFPLAHEVFEGNTFEGKTMLPLLKNFAKTNNVAIPIVVADSAMLSEQNTSALGAEGVSYIVGARLANAPLSFIKKISTALNKEDGKTVRFPSKHGEMICSFSSIRYRKDSREMAKQIEKAQHLIARNEAGRRAKFVRKTGQGTVALNKALIAKANLLLGIKGYCTNVSETILPNTAIIAHYHHLWKVEQAFRMSKSDLAARPIFHHKEEAIRAHILLCFIALMIGKYLEIMTGMSLRSIRDFIWNVTEAHIQDTVSKEIFTFRSPMVEIMRSPLKQLIQKWKLPH